MKLLLGIRSDVGPRSGPNQDSVLGAILPERPDCAVIVASDGMGGAAAGDQASREAIQVFHRLLVAQGLPRAGEVPSRLVEAFQAANMAIFSKSQQDPELEGMGCTAVAAVVIEGQFWVANVGDSRAYLVRKADSRQLTEDHTWINARVKEGLITREQAVNDYYHLNHVLERALGAQPDVEVDVLSVESYRPGDSIVLTTDGLHGVLSDEILFDVVASQPAPLAADALIEQALAAPAHDNLSIVVLQARESE